MPKPIVIAHRGFSREYPENTLAAFEAAIDAGADMIELDITLSADGKLVVIHDDTLSRTTDGGAGFVCHRPARELLALDAGRWFAAAGQRVPALDAVLEAVGGRIQLNIEVKPFYPLQAGRMLINALERLMRDLRERGLLDSTLFSSINFFVLEYLRGLDRSVRLGLIYRRPLTDFDPVYVCTVLNAYSFHPYHRQLDEALLTQMHELGVKVFPYTVNTRERMREMLEQGVDGMFTDCPDWLREELSQ